MALQFDKAAGTSSDDPEGNSGDVEGQQTQREMGSVGDLGNNYPA